MSDAELVRVLLDELDLKEQEIVRLRSQLKDVLETLQTVEQAARLALAALQP